MRKDSGKIHITYFDRVAFNSILKSEDHNIFREMKNVMRSSLRDPHFWCMTLTFVISLLKEVDYWTYDFPKTKVFATFKIIIIIYAKSLAQKSRFRNKAISWNHCEIAINIFNKLATRVNEILPICIPDLLYFGKTCSLSVYKLHKHVIQVLVILFVICNHSMQFIFKSNERSREWSRRKTEW